MNFQTLKDYFQEFIECNQHKIMFLNGKDDIFEEFKVIDAINFLEEKDKEIERLNNKNEELLTLYTTEREVKEDYKSIIKEVREYIEESKSKLPLGINDFTCEMVYSDEVVLANELLEILDKVGGE